MKYKSLNVQEVHDVEPFKRGASYAASVRRQVQTSFPLQLSDHPGMISRCSLTVAIPQPPRVPENCTLPRIDRELGTFRKTNRQGMS
jgi:hypothetical protein